MIDSPVTRASLLIRVRDPRDVVAWQEFVHLYSPLVYGFARNRGLQDADAADLMQDVLRSVSGAMGRLDYDPQRGSFRSWLFTVTRNKLNTFLTRQRRQVRGTGDTDVYQVLEQPAGDEEDVWEQQYQRRLFDWATEHVRSRFGETVWQAFWRTAVDGQPAQDVAKSLGMSVGAVYVAKSRVLAQIKLQVQTLEGQSDDGSGGTSPLADGNGQRNSLRPK